MNNIECHFVVEIKAPNGLVGIDRHMNHCKLPLYPWKSGFNGKIILRASGDDLLDWNMDSSTDESMFASGWIFAGVKDAESLLRSLSNTLVNAGFSHQISFDDPDGECFATFGHQW